MVTQEEAKHSLESFIHGTSVFGLLALVSSFFCADVGIRMSHAVSVMKKC